VESCAKIMAQLAKRPEMIYAKAKVAATDAHKFTYDKMVQGYVDVINQYFGVHPYGY